MLKCIYTGPGQVYSVPAATRHEVGVGGEGGGRGEVGRDQDAEGGVSGGGSGIYLALREAVELQASVHSVASVDHNVRLLG